VQANHYQQENARGPEQFRVGLEKVAVAIDGFGSEEKLQVAREMPHDEQKKYKPRNRHDVFFAQR
jgi:hypothetical protein